MIVGLDLGTSSIRVAIGELDEQGKIQIAGTAVKKSKGLRNGVIVTIEDAKDAIREAVEAAEQNAGFEVTSVVTAIGGAQIESQNSRGVVPVRSGGKNNREITRDDVDRVIENATAIIIPDDREKLHVIAQDYIVDGYGGITDPIHRIGIRLEAEVHIVTAAKTIIQNLRSCILRAGYSLNGVFLKTLVQTQSVCHDDELELGSILIDLGAGTTDVIVLLNGAPISTASIPLGGNVVTSDIANSVKIPVAEAERIKVESGCCWLPGIRNDADVIIPGVGNRAPDVIKQSLLCQIIQARMMDVFVMVRNAVIQNTSDSIKQLSGNIILTGGGAQMEGVVELAQAVFKTSSVRIGVPENLGGIEENYRRPDFATAIGLVVANKKMAAERDAHKKPHVRQGKTSGGKENVFKKIKNIFF